MPPRGTSAAEKPLQPDTFHNVGRLFPDETKPPTVVAPTATVAEALKLMIGKRYSLLPVVDAGKVVGVFSLWTTARLVLTARGQKGLSELTVEDVMDRQIRMVTVQDALDDVVRFIERDEAVLVGSRHQLEAIATSWDLLKYFFEATHAFVLLGEIELALRDIIARLVGAEELGPAIQRALSHKRGPEPVPLVLYELELDDYRAIITTRANWHFFDGVLGHNRDFVDTRLKRVRDIRNRVFHFRGDVSVEDQEFLVEERGWLLERISRAPVSNGDAISDA